MERLQFSWALFMLLIGLVGAILGYLSLVVTRRERLLEEHPDLPIAKPIPPVLWLVYLGTGAFMIGYVVWAVIVKPHY